MAKREIIVFDEATANLDIESENSILEATDRLFTISNFNCYCTQTWNNTKFWKIIVMDKGNLVGFDSHTNLLEQNETYKELFSAWNLVN